jgi:hypothetical protein
MSTAVRIVCTNWPSKGSKPAVPILIIGAAAGILEREEKKAADGWATPYLIRFLNSYACALIARR